MKSGEISQVFVYISVVIVFAVVFLFGYRAISHFIDEGEKVAFITFKNDIEDAIKSVDFGSVTVYHAERPLRIPSKYAKVCFIDYDFGSRPGWAQDPPTANCPADLSTNACDAARTYDNWETSNANVFLSPEGLLDVKVHRIKLKNENNEPQMFLCINTAGRLDMRLVGQGSHTLIAPYRP
ncbi:MAG TPA: hypothetical protein VJB66_01965 [Candidatus Nanoarchaeia archaeon]|nr:hypothetical protein [Candidatus Nanoarchaeia archaeon]